MTGIASKCSAGSDEVLAHPWIFVQLADDALVHLLAAAGWLVRALFHDLLAGGRLVFLNDLPRGR